MSHQIPVLIGVFLFGGGMALVAWFIITPSPASVKSPDQPIEKELTKTPSTAGMSRSEPPEPHLAAPRLDAQFAKTPTPRSLGGSDTDFLDMNFETWRPIKGALDVVVNWNDIAQFDVVAAASVRVNGTVQVGVLETRNAVVVAQQDISRSSPVPSNPTGPVPLPNAQTIRLRIPRDVGLRTYRLVARRNGGQMFAQVWASAELQFEPVLPEEFATIPLGGERASFLEKPTDLQDGIWWHTAAQAVDAYVEWSGLPDATLLAKIQLFMISPTYERGEYAIRIRDLTTNAIVATSNWIPTQRVGLVGSGRPARVIETAIRLFVPRSTGKRGYRMEVGITKAGISVAAVGELCLAK